MSDTIDFLEVIGENASLRYASPTELSGTLKQAGASGALMAALLSGDTKELSVDLGDEEPIFAPQITNAFWPMEHG